MDDNFTFGAVLRSVRMRAGLTQTELGNKCGIVPNKISNWELGHGHPFMSDFRKLCKALGCSADELLGLSPDTLTPQEYKSLKRYRMLDDDGRHTVDAVQDSQLRRLGLLDLDG